MRHLKIILCSLFALLALGLTAQAGIFHARNTGSVPSPDGKIRLAWQPRQKSVIFQIAYAHKELMQGDLALMVQGTNLLDGARVDQASLGQGVDSYEMPMGKNNPIHDPYREVTLNLENPTAPIRKFQVVFRVYNGGVAYRYVFPKQAGADSIEITDEPGRFRLEGDPQMWPLYRENYTTSHEGNYDAVRYSALTANELMDVPLLAQFDNGVGLSIALADLRNYAGMYLRAEGDGANRVLRCDLSPLPGQPGIKVISALPLSSPWRVFLIGSSPGKLIESNLITDLNDPSVISDTSWIKPGKTTFYWWNGNQEPTNPLAAVKWEEDYIDFCASNGIAYHAVIGTDGDHPWYHQTRAHYDPPGPDADATRTRDGFPIADVIRYAHARGVDVRVWVHWKVLDGHLDEVFTQFEKWGISGMMVDFLNRNDQQMVLFTEQVLQCAARHHLQIQFHGVWAPTGLERTYPNLINHEGVLNLEYLKWTKRCTPQHDVTAAYTRMLAGPMDYHLGGFHAATQATFKPQVINPRVYGTRCLMLAMYVLYQNPMPMMCGTPEDYAGQPGFDFLCEVPTTWNETRFLDGQVGQYIVLARRQGADWYLGAMNDWTPRQLKIPAKFLGPGKYEVETWADDLNSTDPNALVFSKRIVEARDVLELNLAGGGGQVMRIRPLKK